MNGMHHSLETLLATLDRQRVPNEQGRSRGTSLEESTAVRW
jgi:hypothetical protein